MKNVPASGSAASESNPDRLSRYRLIATAMSFVGTSTSAMAQVAYSGASRNIDVPTAGSFFFDIDEDSAVTGYSYGIADLFLRNYIFSGGQYISVSKVPGNYGNPNVNADPGSFVGFTARTEPVTGFGYASALSNGFLVDATSTTTDQVYGGASISAFANLGYTLRPVGDPGFFNFPPTPAFVGFEFGSEVLGGTRHFGWLQVLASVPGGQLWIVDWAFETQPGVAIAAGDTGQGLLISDLPGAIPEPSALALLALGCTGLSMLRERRKPQTDDA